MDINLDNYQILDQFNVSRETYHILESFKKLVIDKNKKINLIGPNTVENFIKRHTVDCAQAIDFIDINNKTCTDLGSGAGLPGMVLAILLRDRNIEMKMILYEKSYHKSLFMMETAKKFKLDVKVLKQDIFKQSDIVTGTILARAFKPLPKILELVEKNFLKYSNLIVFMGKNGKQILKDSFKNWKFDYIETKSITSNNSFLLNIKNIKKK